MGFIIGLLTVVMVVDCLLLILLVLMQLPKKDAGAGLAFGGAATDALFGAGSGNFLTKATKYTAVIFFVLAVMLSVMQSKFHRGSGAEFQRSLTETPAEPAPISAPQPAHPAPTPAASAATNSSLLIPVPSTGSSNAAPK